MMGRMSIDEFRDRYSYAPLDEDELAESVTSLLIDCPLKDAAKQYLSALKTFRCALVEADIEMG